MRPANLLKASTVLAAALALATGCAPLEPDSNLISIETVSGGAMVADATCRVSNGYASWEVRTPAAVPAAGGSGGLHVACEKPGYRSSDVILQGGAYYQGYPSSSLSVGLGASTGGWRRGGLGLGLGVTQPIGRPAARYPQRVVVEMTPQQ
jgi:hypothetical protein